MVPAGTNADLDEIALDVAPEAVLDELEAAEPGAGRIEALSHPEPLPTTTANKVWASRIPR
jgi:hypothetical protein